MTEMERRKKLSNILHEILGTSNVYFDPPESIKMSYPAIVYKVSKIDKQYADNHRYKTNTRYNVTYIRKKADDSVIEAFLDLPYCEHTNEYKVSDLYHDTFTITV